MFRRYDPFAEMFETWRDFDGIFRRFMSGVQERPADLTPRRLLPKLAEATTFTPAIECFTKDKQLILKAELPGVDPKQVEVAVVGNRLIIKGEKREERHVEEADLFIEEIAQGRFERSFELPEGVKKEQVKAFFQNGVLEIAMPAVGLETQHKVPVEVVEGGKKDKAVKAA